MLVTALPRLDRSMITTTLFLRPRRPDDHREFEMLLPHCTPLFVYADEDGRDWLRWSLPRVVAEKVGLGDMRCDCCGEPLQGGGDHAVVIDTARDETDWFFDELVVG